MPPPRLRQFCRGPAQVAAPSGAVTIGGNGHGAYSATSCGSPSGDTTTCTATFTPNASDVAGTYNETASYAGDTNYTSSTSPQTGNFSIGTATAATTVNCVPSTTAYGVSTTCTADVNGEFGLLKGRVKKNVTGSVSWSANTGCSTSSVTGNPGVATCTTSILPVGSDTVEADYSGTAITARAPEPHSDGHDCHLVDQRNQRQPLVGRLRSQQPGYHHGSSVVDRRRRRAFGVQCDDRRQRPQRLRATSCGSPSGNTITCTTLTRQRCGCCGLLQRVGIFSATPTTAPRAARRATTSPSALRPRPRAWIAHRIRHRLRPVGNVHGDDQWRDTARSADAKRDQACVTGT